MRQSHKRVFRRVWYETLFLWYVLARARSFSQPGRSFFQERAPKGRNMAEEEGGGHRRDGGHTPIPPPPPDAATEQHDRHTQSTSTIRMIVMDSRFRQHGLKVNASTHIDGDEPLVSGKVIMALGSKDDMLNEVSVADQDPHKYMIGEES